MLPSWPTQNAEQPGAPLVPIYFPMMVPISVLEQLRKGAFPQPAEAAPAPHEPEGQPREQTGEVDILDQLHEQFEEESLEIEQRMRAAQRDRECSMQARLEKEFDTFEPLDAVKDSKATPVEARPYNMLSSRQQIELERRLRDEAKYNLALLQVAPYSENYHSQLKQEIDRLFNEWEEHCRRTKKVRLPELGQTC